MNFTVDFANYTGEGTTITLIDWTSGSGSQALLDAATQNFNNASGYGDIALTWDAGNTAINLSFIEVVIIPEPSTLALLGAGGAMLLAARRRRSRG